MLETMNRPFQKRKREKWTVLRRCQHLLSLCCAQEPRPLALSIPSMSAAHQM